MKEKQWREDDRMKCTVTDKLGRAQLTGKQHKHVMEAIRKMEKAWMDIAGSNFRLGSYKDLNGQLRPCYSFLILSFFLHSSKIPHFIGIFRPKFFIGNLYFIGS